LHGEGNFMSTKVLIAEDNPADFEIVEFTLRQAGLEIAAQRVDTEEDFRSALTQFSPDIVLSDYEMPGFNGVEALKILKELRPDIPFILVTGAIGEEAAIEVLTGGATDYVLKSRLSRLTPAVERALAEAREHRKRKEAEADRDLLLSELEARVRERTRELQEEIEQRKLAEAAAHQEKDRLAALVDSISDEIWFTDNQKIFKLANSSVLKEFGFTSMTNIDVRQFLKTLEIYNPDGSPRPVDDSPALRALRGEMVKDQEEIVRTPATQKMRYRQVSASPVKDMEGRIIGSVMVVRDVSDRKQAEEDLQIQRELLESLVNNMPAGAMLIRGFDLRILLANPAFQKIASGKIVNSRTILEVWPELEPRIVDLINQVLATGRPHNAVDEPFQVRRSKGSPPERRYFSWSLFRVRLPGDEWGILATLWETTDRKCIEDSLIRAKDDLESKVQQRTAELAEMNESLTAEIQERKRAEKKLRTVGKRPGRPAPHHPEKS
jgi:PAS domain S-box-containing protein